MGHGTTDGFQVGDRIEWTGESSGEWGPQPGDRGWLVMIHPMDDIIVWDEYGDDTGDFTGHSGHPLIRRVEDRNEPDPSRWKPGGPHRQRDD